MVMIEIPEHIVKRLSAYYKVGGFFRESKPPILVLNALDDITHFDRGEPMPSSKPFRRVPPISKGRSAKIKQESSNGN